jgi:hypothetical protein
MTEQRPTPIPEADDQAAEDTTSAQTAQSTNKQQAEGDRAAAPDADDSPPAGQDASDTA